MDRSTSKPKDHKTDDLAVVKAAAWAWHQHSSGSEGRAARDFDARRTHRDPKPSRYKLEAMRMAYSQETKEGVREGSSPVHTKKLPLLDAYEVRSILTRLDSLVAESTFGGSKLSNGFSSANASLDDNGGGRMKKKKVRKGVWQKHGVICSTREEDVVDGRRKLREGQIQISAKRVLPVKCSMPRANGAMCSFSKTSI